MTSLRRTASLLVVLAMMMTMTALPAFAVASGSATITAGSELLSGQSALINLRISNTAGAGVLGVGGGSAIDAFVIEVPQQVVDVADADVTLPSGWFGGYDDEIGFIFAEAEEGSELAPGGNLNVEIGVDADAIPDDRTGRFVTSVSDNGGVTLSPAGEPQVISRILEISTAVVKKPSSATNTDVTQVTAGQDTASFDVTVRNYGTQARDVVANVNRTGGSSSSLTTTAKTDRINPGVTKTLNVKATFGNAGTLNSQAVATVGQSAARALNVAQTTVQAAFAANLVNNSLVPSAVAQNSTTDISYRINKTAGAQPVSGNATFAFSTFSTSAPQSFDAANGQKNVTFPQVRIPNLPNGQYDTTSTITGLDANGANVSVTLEPGKLTLDNLLPIVTIVANPGDSDVPNTVAATTNGRTITFSGSIKLNDAGNSTCTNCSIAKAVLRALPSGSELPLNLTNTNGTLSGSQSFTFPANTTSTVAVVTASRPTGAVATGTSNTVPVDLNRPSLFDPGLTGRESANDVIIIPLLDDGLLLDAEVSRATDWLVDNNTVIDVIGSPNENGANSVKLVLQNRLGDNDTPTVSYTPRPLVSTRMHDRVSLTVADQVIDTLDGIIPAAPVIETVAGLARQPDQFFTNDSTPDVTLSALVPGNTIEIFYDINDNGVADNGEGRVLAPIEENSQTFTLGNIGTTGRTATLVARMKDKAGNLGAIDTDVLNLDFTAARIIDFTVSGNDVTVVFNEPISARGRNAAFDWTVNVTDANGTANRTVTQVTQGSDLTTRVLTVSSSSWNGQGTVNATRYKFRGQPDDRYDDRATNDVADVNFAK